MPIGFTGTQNGMTDAQKREVRLILEKAQGPFHHGDCIGADAEAHDIALAIGLKIVSHPPSAFTKRAFRKADVEHPPLPYLERNRAIVDATISLIATPGDDLERVRSGTWSTVRYARSLGRPVCVILPDGVRQITGKPLVNPANNQSELGLSRADKRSYR